MKIPDHIYIWLIALTACTFWNTMVSDGIRISRVNVEEKQMKYTEKPTDFTEVYTFINQMDPKKFKRAKQGERNVR